MATLTNEDIKRVFGDQGLDFFEKISFPTEFAKLFAKEKEYPNRLALLRTDTETFLSIVSEAYQFVSHRNAVEDLLPAIQAVAVGRNEALQFCNRTSLVFNQGAIMHCEFAIGRTRPLATTKNSGEYLIKPVITIQNSYDRTVPYGFLIKSYVSGKGIPEDTEFLGCVGVTVRHSAKTPVGVLSRQLDNGLQSMYNLTGRWAEMGKTLPNPLQWGVFARRATQLLGPDFMEEIEEKMRVNFVDCPDKMTFAILVASLIKEKEVGLDRKVVLRGKLNRLISESNSF